MAIFQGKVSAREFLVDFFGALMPGVFFLIFLFLSLLGQSFLLFQAIFCCLGYSDFTSVSQFVGTSEMNILDQISKIPVVLDVALFIIFLAIGYIVGTLFYRQDPKIPDHKSFLRIINGFSIEQEVRSWVVRVPLKTNTELSFLDKLKIRLSPTRKYALFNVTKTGVPEEAGEPGDGVSGNVDNSSKKKGASLREEHSYDYPKTMHEFNVLESDVQFPYNNLKAYLVSRGWDELGAKVGWDYHEGKMPESYPRSKTFINSLKIWLQFHFPEKCSTIVKNEAHVRLSSSMWYVSKKLKMYSLAGLGLTLLAGVLFRFSGYSNFVKISKELFAFMLLGAVIAFMSWRIKKLIESFLHYQRVREIFYVLNTAHIAELSLKKEEKRRGVKNKSFLKSR